MQSHQSIELLDLHIPLWERMQPIFLKNRIPQALLFVVPGCVDMSPFINRFIAKLNCSHVHEELRPCKNCRMCHLLMQNTHPDIHRVVLENLQGSIKIEQIRVLHHEIYQTPQLGQRRFIVIDSADKLNLYAANALLKMLEEPPEATTFILVAEQLGQLPATIVSRCQKYAFSPLLNNPKVSFRYLSLGELYTENSGRHALFNQNKHLLSTLLDMFEKRITPCTVAEQWSEHGLEDLLCYLYLFMAEMVHYRLSRNFASAGSRIADEKTYTTFIALIHYCRPENYLQHMQAINEILRKSQQNISLNKTLAIESLLIKLLA